MQTLTKLLLILLIACPAYSLTVVQWYVDPDATGAGDGTSFTDAYTSFDAFRAAEGKNLVTADEKFTVNCQSSGGTDDTGTIVSTGFTMDATRFLEVRGDDFPADGILDTSKYFVNITDATPAVAVAAFMEIRNLQVRLTSTDATARTIVSGTNTTSIIDGCILEAVNSGTSYIWGVSPTATVYNSTLIGDSVHATSAGTWDGGLTINVYNSVIWGWSIGMQEIGVSSADNCIIANNGNDINGAVAVDYCATDDGDGTNSIAPSGGTWANELVDPNNANPDFNLVAGGNCEGGGTDDPSSGGYSVDIISTAYTSPWSVGAYAGPPSSGQIFRVIMSKAIKPEVLWLDGCF